MTEVPRAPSWPIIWQTFWAYAFGTDCSSSPYEVVRVCGSLESGSLSRYDRYSRYGSLETYATWLGGQQCLGVDLVVDCITSFGSGWLCATCQQLVSLDLQ